MAAAVAQEGALQDDFLIWRYAGGRARQAAEAARARAEAAAEQDRSERRGLRGLTPALERAVRGLSLRRHPSAVHPTPVSPAARPVAIITPAPRAAEPVAVATPLTVVAPVTAAVPVAQPYAEHDSPAASLAEILSRGVTVPLRVAFLMYDDVLEALQRLHASGATHGGVAPAAIAVDMEGRCSLHPAHRAVPGVFPATSPMADVNAATAVLVEALAGRRSTDRSPAAAGSSHPTPLVLNALPVPARRLVEEALASQAALRTPSAGKLRADLAVTAMAFLGDDWEPGARAWLAAAAYARCAALREEEAAARAASDEGKRPLLFGGVKRRESRIFIGLGVAAGASVTLVAGAAVAMSGSRADVPQPATRASIVAPAPSVVPSLSPASPVAVAPFAAPPTAAPTPQPTAPQVVTRPAANPPATFAPVPVPTLPPTLTPAASPTPAPTPSQCLLGIVCP